MHWAGEFSVREGVRGDPFAERGAVGPCLGPYGGPGGEAVSYERGTPVQSKRGTPVQTLMSEVPLYKPLCMHSTGENSVREGERGDLIRTSIHDEYDLMLFWHIFCLSCGCK